MLLVGYIQKQLLYGLSWLVRQWLDLMEVETKDGMHILEENSLDFKSQITY